MKESDVFGELFGGFEFFGDYELDGCSVCVC